MNNVIAYYDRFDEWGRLDREPIEFIINLHHIQSMLPPQGHILDNGAGPGKYAVELAKLGYRMTLTDLTPSSVDAAKRKAAEFGVLDQFEGFYAADARDLSMLPDEHVDAALMLGPLYHLQTEEGRVSAVKELHRVTKPGGLVFVAVMSKTRFFMNSLCSPSIGNRTIRLKASAGFCKPVRSITRTKDGLPGPIILTSPRSIRLWSPKGLNP